MATVIESTMSFKEPTATQARCRKTNEAMLILCRIDTAEAGKPYWKIPVKYHTLLTNMTAIGRHVNATSRKRVEIQAS